MFANPCRALAICIVTILIVTSPVNAASLLRLERGPLEISLDSSSSGRTGYFLSVRDSASEIMKTAKVEAFTVGSPTRVVIDVFGYPSKIPYAQPIDDAVVSAFRIGVHPDKTRFVIDLKENREPRIAVRRTSDGKSVVILFGYNDGQATTPTTTTTSTTLAPVPTEIPVYTDTTATTTTTTTTIEPEPTPESTTESTTTTTTTSTTTQPEVTPPLPGEPGVKVPLGGQATVTGIAFQLAEKNQAPAVVINTENLSDYRVMKKRSSLYELVIGNAKLGGDSLRLTQFPPETFRGLEAVVAHTREDSVVVKIYVEDNIKLFPYRSGNQIWVKVAD